ncbi:MAG: hypothetical protein AAFU72_05445 [Pseudomonadota bacterium]
MTETTALRPATGMNVTRIVVTTLLAGAIGLAFWELWIRFGAPPTTGKFPLEGPIGLAQASLNKLFGISAYKDDNLFLGVLSGRGIAEIAHFSAAFIAYPLGFLIAARPIGRAVLGRVGTTGSDVVTGLVYGALLFVFAGYVMGHLVAGFPPFFGWKSITVWTGLPPGSFIGHVLLGLGIAIGAMVADRAFARSPATGRA